MKNLRKIEFVVTDACTGKCKHCSEGFHAGKGTFIAPTVAAELVREVADHFPLETVLAFGGEPLLYPDAVYAIITAAKEKNVPHRQVITNGFFSQNEEEMVSVAARLASCGVTDLRLSVDAFHQETIPLDVVKRFALCAKREGLPVLLQPAWLVGKEDLNPYNKKTREILDEFSVLGFSEGEGNVIFPEGNAKRFLAEYFTETIPENPYVEDPKDVRCLSFDPDGNVFGENVYRKSILEIIKEYRP